MSRLVCGIGTSSGHRSLAALAAPDGPELYPVQTLLEARSYWVDDPAEVPAPHQFPIAGDERGDTHALLRTGPSGGWELWMHGKDDGLSDWQRPKHQLRVLPGEKPPLYWQWELEEDPPIGFDEWLDALSDGIEAGRIVAAPWGLKWAERGPKLAGFHENHDPTNAYPWI